MEKAAQINLRYDFNYNKLNKTVTVTVNQAASFIIPADVIRKINDFIEKRERAILTPDKRIVLAKPN